MRLFASGEIRDREGRFFVTNQGLIPTHNQTNLQGRTRYASMTICSRQQSASPRSECGGGPFASCIFVWFLSFFHTFGLFPQTSARLQLPFSFPVPLPRVFRCLVKISRLFFKPFFYFSFLLGSVPGPSLFTECEEWSRQREGPSHDFFQGPTLHRSASD